MSLPKQKRNNMTKKEYEEKYYRIATSNAPIDVREKLLEELRMKYMPVTEKAMKAIEESSPDPIEAIE